MVFNANSSFTMQWNDTEEKFAIANRDFKIGDEIFFENVLVFGPVAEPRFIICISCGVEVDGAISCYDCGWPICEYMCDKLEFHTSNECEILKKYSTMSFQRFAVKKNGIYHQYDCILPLRILLLIERSPEKWKNIEALNSFVEIRRDDALWRREELYVVNYIRQKCKLKKYNVDLIHKICGIINANSFPSSNAKYNIRCIYSKSHYFSHSCIPNSTFTILPNHNFRIYIRASVDILKGEKLTYSKTKPIMPTLLRRQELVQNFYLSCYCRRCSDATELQSNFSSLRCPKCAEGIVLSENPLDFEANWKCTACMYQKRYPHLKKLYRDVEKELNKVKDKLTSQEAVQKCEILLQKYEPMFHFNHSFIVYLKYYSTLMSLDGPTFHISEEYDIDSKIIRLYEILNVFDIVTPGFTAMRGTTLHLLYKAYVVKAKLYNNEQVNDQQKFRKYMSKAMKLLDMTEEVMVIGKPFLNTSEC